MCYGHCYCSIITSTEQTKSESLLSISEDVKCFCIEHMKCGGQKKQKHIKPIVKLLNQLIISCKEQPEVIMQACGYYCVIKKGSS